MVVFIQVHFVRNSASDQHIGPNVIPQKTGTDISSNKIFEFNTHVSQSMLPHLPE